MGEGSFSLICRNPVFSAEQSGRGRSPSHGPVPDCQRIEGGVWCGPQRSEDTAPGFDDALVRRLSFDRRGRVCWAAQELKECQGWEVCGPRPRQTPPLSDPYGSRASRADLRLGQTTCARQRPQKLGKQSPPCGPDQSNRLSGTRCAGEPAPAWNFKRKALYSVPEWCGRLPRRTFPYVMNLTRIVSVQLVRVFFIVRETLIGKSHIVVSSVRTARLLPQPGEPISPGRASGPALLL